MCSDAPRQAVVTGSSSGIGQAIARRLLADGWHVIGVDQAPATLAHTHFTTRQADLADLHACRSLAAALQPHAPDALIHAAGILRTARLGELRPDDGALMWQLHVQAAACLADALIPAMAARGQGRAVFIGSRVAQGLPGRSQYAASKAALIAMARSWAGEVAPRGVTVNVVSPGATATPMLYDPSRADSTPRLPPIGRFIEPDEVASLTAYLLSPSAAAITGQDMAICGGASLPA